MYRSIDTRELADEIEDSTDAARVEEIRALFDEVGDEVRYGVELVLEDDFEEHARELAEDVGAIPADSAWPLYCIDWERAARELRADYSCVDFDGERYLYRA